MIHPLQPQCAGSASVLIAILLVTALPVSAQQSLPRQLDTTGFNDVLAQTGRVYIGGQPSPAGLARMQAAGVTTVINLRTNTEMDNRDVVPFDEAALVQELGMRYVHIPAGGPATPYSPEMLNVAAQALEDSSGKVLLHCTVGWRASHLWVAYLNRYGGLSLEEAVAHGRAVNLGTLPLEGFLGQPLVISVADE